MAPSVLTRWLKGARLVAQMKFKAKAASSLNQSWHAVSVVGQSDACQAAKELRDTRFLSAEAPALPLAQCSSPRLCKCIYRHYPDRRKALRRETDRGQYPRPWIAQERRQVHGRRADD